MSSFAHKLLIAIVAISGCFAVQALLTIDADTPAAPEQIEDLTQLLALCPELSVQVAQTLDQNSGLLSQHRASDLIDNIRECRQHYQHLPDNARYRQAYASLRSLISVNAANAPSTRVPAKSLNLKLSQRLPDS